MTASNGNGHASPVELAAPDRAFEPLPPHNTEAEESVLGSLLIDPEAIATVTFLAAADFYHPRNRQIFAAMKRLQAAGHPTDFVMVSDELQRSGELEQVGGVGYLSRVLTVVPTSIHVEHYARIVERTAVTRRVISAASRIVSLAYKDPSIEELAQAADAEIRGAIGTARLGGRGPVHIRDVMRDYLEGIHTVASDDTASATVMTGFMALDALLGGLHGSDLVILAARPSVGKTALALNIARSVAALMKQGVLFFSAEMNRLQLAGRLLAATARLPSSRIGEAELSVKDVERLAKAVSLLSEAPLWIDDEPEIALATLRARATQLASEQRLGLVVVDYLQLVRGPRQLGRVQEVAAISSELKGLARQLQVPVLALSQLSRAVESRHPPVPILSDLRDSGALEQDADVVAFLYREEQYDPDSDRRGMVDVIVAKHRSGPTGRVTLGFDDTTTRFYDADLEFAGI